MDWQVLTINSHPSCLPFERTGFPQNFTPKHVSNETWINTSTRNKLISYILAFPQTSCISKSLRSQLICVFFSNLRKQKSLFLRQSAPVCHAVRPSVVSPIRARKATCRVERIWCTCSFASLQPRLGWFETEQIGKHNMFRREPCSQEEKYHQISWDMWLFMHSRMVARGYSWCMCSFPHDRY